MPRRDGTGPRSEGSMTGKGLGLCKSSNTEETEKTETDFGKKVEREHPCKSGLGYALGHRGGHGRGAHGERAHRHGCGRRAGHRDQDSGFHGGRFHQHGACCGSGRGKREKCSDGEKAREHGSCCGSGYRFRNCTGRGFAHRLMDELTYDELSVETKKELLLAQKGLLQSRLELIDQQLEKL